MEISKTGGKNLKKKAKKGVWILFAIGAVFVLIIVRFATSGSLSDDSFGGMPTSDDAYEIAKDFVRPSLKAASVKFADEGYHFGKLSDSVYVIRSFAETEDEQGDQGRRGFKVVMRYKGGLASLQSNWELVDMSTN